MRQQELFSSEASRPSIEIPGFRLSPEYITPDEEKRLIQSIDAEPWESTYRRRIQQYGLGYSSTHGREAAWVRDFPEWLLSLRRRVSIDASFERLPENCVINEYLPPQGIGAHRDYDDFGPTIACVSLGSDVVIDFTEPSHDLRVPVDVPARSLWVITGPARAEWQHGIAARLVDVIQGERRLRSRRISVTFRMAKHPERIPPH